MQKSHLVAATACALALGAETAQASCVPSTEQEFRQRADAAFVGRVLSVRSSDGSARFRVRRVIKGRLERGDRIRVIPRPHPSSVTINWNPRVGQRWRVYADRPGRRWLTNDCMGTRRA